MFTDDTVLNNMANIVIGVDMDYIIRYANPFALCYLGYKKPELIGKYIDSITHNDNKHAINFTENIWPFIEKKRNNFSITKKIKRTTGVIKNIHWSVGKIYNNKKVTGLILTGHEVAEEYEEKTVHNYGQLFNKIQDVIYIVDSNGDIKDVNEAACKKLRYTREELLKMNTFEIDANLKNNPENRQKMLKKLGTHIEKGKVIFESTLQIKTGKLINVEILLYFNQEEDKANDMSYGIAILRDITEQKQLHKMKDEFIAMLNHDMKNIFSSIIGTSQILLNKDIDSKLKPYITIIEKSSNRMLKLANDFLEYFLSENDKLKLDITNVNLEEITEDAVSTFRILFQEKNLDIRIKSDIKEEIQIDCAKIFTVISNLISNAIKFTPEKGKINISIFKNHDKIKFEIKDTGIGIDKVNVKKIFNAFFTLNKNQYRKRKGLGLGLGLAICKKIIELHGGKIGVESEINNGSSFWFTIPLKIK